MRGRGNRLAVKIQLGAAVDAGVGAIVVTVAVVIIIIVDVVVAAVVGGRVTTSSLFKDGLHHQPDGATYESWHLRVFNG